MNEIFEEKLFSIENLFVIHADNFCTIPASAIYDSKSLEPFMSVIKSCHIYLIGFTPIIDLVYMSQKNRQLTMKYLIAENEHTIYYDLEEGLSLVEDEGIGKIEDSSGRIYSFSESDIQSRLNIETQAVNFDVKYIGQVYGKDGSRNAIDRLLKHETLQKISLRGCPSGYNLSQLLLAIDPKNQVMVAANPLAKRVEEGKARILNGFDKLLNTTEKECIALYEASLIRYFSPEFNTEFKNSFPSTNLKVLQDCYEKDFSGVIAEICIDQLPFRL